MKILCKFCVYFSTKENDSLACIKFQVSLNNALIELCGSARFKEEKNVNLEVHVLKTMMRIYD